MKRKQLLGIAGLAIWMVFTATVTFEVVYRLRPDQRMRRPTIELLD